jgi:hypothetical protein
MADPLIVANCSGFYGDRLSAAREMVDDGPIHALTGDWLAELTMLILARTQAKRPGGGYARTFVTQMEHVMGTCLDNGIKVVSNAGGLDPEGCADAVRQVADKLGLAPKIAYVQGDDLIGRLPELVAAGHDFANIDTGEPIGDDLDHYTTANAYLGCWGIVEALNRGADIVVTGRVTDAAVVAGPAAWHHGWKRDDWDAIAGAIVAGHVIECGAQATGGNYSFFNELSGMGYVGFPIAEIEADGSSVITKHEGTGGGVTVGTVTSQLLYEIGPPAYANPDVISRFDTIELDEIGADRVRISGTRGEPAPPNLKVAMNSIGGYRNSVSIGLTGLDIEAKAALVEEAFWRSCPYAPSDFAQVSSHVVRTDKENPGSNEEAVASWRITVKDPDERKVGRAFTNAGTEIALASIPGFFGLSGGPRGGGSYGVYRPALIPSDLVPQEVVVGDQRTAVDNTPTSILDAPVAAVVPSLPSLPTGPTLQAPLGAIAGARSGDKGGNANLGLFTRSPEAYVWLADFLTVRRFKALMTEAASLEVDRFDLPNIWSLNFVIHGLLEEGVAASTRQDPQAKALGEYLRAKVVDIPAALLA